MNLRKIAALTALISFLLELLTSVILYLVPQGRVAYWADWRLWGLSKTQWTDLHLNLGVLFLIAVCVHVWYNWSAIVAYLKDKARNLRVFTFSFNLALFLTFVVCLGTWLRVPPFSAVLDLGEALKERGSRIYGEPPYGHAELSTLADFSRKTGLDVDEALASLRAGGIKVVGVEQTLAFIAKENAITPKHLYEVMVPPEVARVSGGFPVNPPGGMGRMGLAKLCEEYGLELKAVLAVLEENGFVAAPEESLKDIGSRYARNPHDIYDLLAARFPVAE